MIKSYDLFTADWPYVTLYDAIYKKGSNQIRVSVPMLSIFFYGILHMWVKIDEEHNYKEKMFSFQTWQK
jgi:hypothetical protein